MLRVAVVDDDAQDRAKISAGLDFVAAQKDVSFSISEFDSGDQFLVNTSRIMTSSLWMWSFFPVQTV